MDKDILFFGLIAFAAIGHIYATSDGKSECEDLQTRLWSIAEQFGAGVGDRDKHMSNMWLRMAEWPGTTDEVRDKCKIYRANECWNTVLPIVRGAAAAQQVAYMVRFCAHLGRK